MTKLWGWWRVHDNDTVEPHFKDNMAQCHSHLPRTAKACDLTRMNLDEGIGVYVWMGAVEDNGSWAVYTDQKLFEEA